MKNLDRATRFELKWRDRILWPIARPLGLLYDHLWNIVFSKFFLLLQFLFFPFDRKKKLTRSLNPVFLKKEIFTAANLMTMYGVFLLGELCYTIFKWLHGAEYVHIVSFSSFFLSSEAPSLLLISFLALEVFLTDMIDGPLARWNNAISALGVFLDHARDYVAGTITLLFSIFVTVFFGDWSMFLLELSILVGFGLLWLVHARHIRLGFLESRVQVLEDSDGEMLGFLEKIRSLKIFLTEQYENNFLARVQFAALAASVIACLFFYATQNLVIRTLFIGTSLIALVTTYYYLYFKIAEYAQKKKELLGTSGK